jgi:hypothetical protein
MQNKIKVLLVFRIITTISYHQSSKKSCMSGKGKDAEHSVQFLMTFAF